MDKQALFLGLSKIPAKVAMVILWHMQFHEFHRRKFYQQNVVIIARKTSILELYKVGGRSVSPLLRGGTS